MIFERLRLIDDLVPGDGAWNMAVDEMLVQEIVEPTLRVYRWSEPTVTVGYFEKIADARRLRPGLPLMRRWTGGGLVDHGEDWTYSLMIPASHELAKGGRRESYCAIHRVIQQVALHCGMVLEMAGEEKKMGEGCFAHPVEGDLLLDGQKIAGAAQRRTRHGLLHQGSIQKFSVKNWSAQIFADSFTGQVDLLPLTNSEKLRAAALVSTRYDRAEWLERF